MCSVGAAMLARFEHGNRRREPNGPGGHGRPNMARITKYAEIRVVKVRELWFLDVPGDETSVRAAIPCDEHGNMGTLAGARAETVRACREMGCAEEIRISEETVREPAECRCACGATVVLWDTWATDCQRCGREYNGSGQELADRRFWGDETGERF